jgi:hypothetical protein
MEAMSLYSSSGRSLVVAALLSGLATGCVENESEKKENRFDIQQEIDRFMAEKTGAGAFPANSPTWVVVEGDVSQLLNATSATSSWKLVSPTDSTKEVTILESRMSKEKPNLAWLLVKGSDARLIDSVASPLPWRVILGTEVSSLVQVRGYYSRNGKAFCYHFVAPNGTTAAGARPAASQTGGGTPGVGNVPASPPNVSKTVSNSSAQ